LQGDFGGGEAKVHGPSLTSFRGASEPGIQSKKIGFPVALDSGSALSARPGMTCRG
jgi:hypothetical protein